MKRLLQATIAAAALMAATPSYAEIIEAPSSLENGTLVHGINDPSTKEGTTVTGQLGIGGDNVYFTGETTGDDTLVMSPGQGQAEVTTPEIEGVRPPENYLITSLDIFMDPGTTWGWIELALIGSGTVTFTLTDDLGSLFVFDPVVLQTSAENKFAFRAINGESIANLHFDVTGGGVEEVRQVRLDLASGAIPEPAVWAMMLLGFGAIGSAVRRRRAKPAVQFA